jgi:N-acyl homoserine lactone hydrolase
MLAALAGHRLARLTILDCGTFSVRGGERVIGIPAYLLTTDQGAQVLVDGGFPEVYQHSVDAAAGADGLGSFGTLLDHGPAKGVAAQLALCGRGIGDLAAHVLTHGHIDHVGALPLIACPLILTARERADPRPSYFGRARPVAWPEVPTLTLDAEATLCGGVRLVPTPGHTPGHLSLVLDLPKSGRIVLAGDAINRATEPDEGFPDAEDPETARGSSDRLFALGGHLVYGHDPAQWRTLRKAPDVYD